MAYPLPPWIHAPEPIAQSYATGIGLAQQRAEMQQRAQEAAVRNQLAQQAQQLEREREAFSQAYQQQRLSLEQQEMATQQQLAQLKIQDAQRRFEAQQQYQRDVAGGMDPLQAVMKNFPGTDESMTGYGQLARQMQLQKRMLEPAKVVTFKDPNTGKSVSFLQHYSAEGTPSYTPMHAQQDVLARTMMDKRADDKRTELRELRKKLSTLQTDPAYQRILTKPEAERSDFEKAQVKEGQSLVQEMNDVQREIDQIYAEAGIIAPPATAAAPAAQDWQFKPGTIQPSQAAAAPVSPQQSALEQYAPGAGSIAERLGVHWATGALGNAPAGGGGMVAPPAYGPPAPEGPSPATQIGQYLLGTPPVRMLRRGATGLVGPIESAYGVVVPQVLQGGRNLIRGFGGMLGISPPVAPPPEQEEEQP